MKINPDNPAVLATMAPERHAERHAERHTDGQAQHQRWRAELERAQWQARQRYSPAREVAARMAGPAQDSAAVAARAPRPGQAAGAAGVAGAGPATASVPARPQADNTAANTAANTVTNAETEATLPQSGPPPRNLATALGPAQAQVPAAVAPATGGPAMPLAGGTPAPWPGTVQAALAEFTGAAWPARCSQVFLDGKRLSVVLRDAGLAEGDGPLLHQRLQARCQAHGLVLGELIINGVPVNPVA